MVSHTVMGTTPTAYYSRMLENLEYVSVRIQKSGGLQPFKPRLTSPFRVVLCACSRRPVASTLRVRAHTARISPLAGVAALEDQFARQVRFEDVGVANVGQRTGD